jgi:hypothetical protein
VGLCGASIRQVAIVTEALRLDTKDGIEASRPILTAEVSRYQRVAPVRQGQSHSMLNLVPATAGTNDHRRLHTLRILTAEHLLRECPELVEHTLRLTSPDLPADPVGEPTTDLHPFILVPLLLDTLAPVIHGWAGGDLRTHC